MAILVREQLFNAQALRTTPRRNGRVYLNVLMISQHTRRSVRVIANNFLQVLQVNGVDDYNPRASYCFL